MTGQCRLSLEIEADVSRKMKDSECCIPTEVGAGEEGVIERGGKTGSIYRKRPSWDFYRTDSIPGKCHLAGEDPVGGGEAVQLFPERFGTVKADGKRIRPGGEERLIQRRKMI